MSRERYLGDPGSNKNLSSQTTLRPDAMRNRGLDLPGLREPTALHTGGGPHWGFRV